MLFSVLALLVMCFTNQLHELQGIKFTSHRASNRTSILLGGLFSVHVERNGNCGKLRRSSFVKAEAMAFAVHFINEKEKNLLPNITLEFDIRDTCENSNIALEEVVEMMDFGMDSESARPGTSGLVGATQSDISISVARLSRIFQVPQISYSSTATILSDTTRFDYFFRTIPSDNLQAKAIADLIAYFNWTYVIAIHSDDIYGRDGINGLIEELGRNNQSQVCIVTKPEITELSVDGHNNFDQVIEFIQQEWIQNASVVVLFSQFSTAISMLDAVHNATGLEHLMWIAGDSWAKSVPDYLNGRVIGTVPKAHQINDFNDYFASLNPENYTSNPWFTEYWEDVFSCSLNQTSMALPCNVQSQKLTSKYTFADRGGIAYVVDAVYAYAHAIQNMINDFCSNCTETLCSGILHKRFSKDVLNGALLREYLFNVSFTSLSSRNVYFDAVGDMQGEYEIINMYQSGTLRKVGTWDPKHSIQVTDKIEWANGDVPTSVCSLPCSFGHEPIRVPLRTDCCWTCEPCDGDNTFSTGIGCSKCPTGTSPNDESSECVDNPVTFLTWSNPWAVLILIGTCVGLTVTAFVIAVFILFSKYKVIKACSRELCGVLLTGIVLCYILPFFFLAKPSPPICAIRRFGVGVCFSVCFSPLLMRANRIYRVFHDAPRTPRFASSLYQVLFSCCLIAIQVLISTVWLAAEKPSIVYIYGRKITELRCGESPYIGLSISLVYNFILLALSTYYAFLSRKIPANFNETKVLGVTLYSICIIWLAFIPTYFSTIKFGIVYQTTSLVVAVLLSATTNLVCLLVPKVILVFWGIWKNKDEKDKKHSPPMETDITSMHE